jgi:voltage-gated sodium channel
MTRLLHFLVGEIVVVTVILISALALFMHGFAEPGTGAASFWFAVDYGCVVFFVVELVTKIGLEGRRLFWAQRWNRFDSAIIMLSTPVLMIPFVDLRAFTGVPVLRLARLFRLFRLLRFIPERDRLAAGIVRALKASVGVFLAVALVNFIFAMGAHLLFREIAPQHFGTPLEACYSIFQVFTVEGWYEIPQAIAVGADNDTWEFFARVYFSSAVLIGGILGLSLGNAVFVDQMMTDNTVDLEHKVDELSDEIRMLRDEIREMRAGR